MTEFKLKPLAGLLLALYLSGCAMAPEYHKPDVPIPAQFKENDAWQQASPQDQHQRGHWWEAFGDAKLNELEASIEHTNTNIAIALARFNAAQSDAQALDAGLYPSVGLQGSALQNRQSDDRPLRGSNQPNVYGANTLGIHASYELDLWGRIRNSVAIGSAQAEAAQADLASATLSIQSDLAELYILVRRYDIESNLMAETIKAYERALTLTQNRHNGGITSGLDVARAQNQLATARAEITEVASKRALSEHAIAQLEGLPASQFSIPPSITPIASPQIPAVVPSALLQRRPDIAAAERRVFAANEAIGVARSALFPRLGLSGDFGWQNTGGALISAPERFWSIGPTALLSLFDAGARDARIQASKAEFDASAATYRGTVLAAFRQTEDQLALSHHLASEISEETIAVDAAQRALGIADHRYREGVVNYLEVVTAQTAALQAQRTALDLHTRLLRSHVGLIRAIGGDFGTQTPDSQSPSAKMAAADIIKP